MTVYAELHDGRKLEFPDGTDPAVVQATVKKMLGAPAQTDQPAPPDSTAWGRVKAQTAALVPEMRDAALGAVRGAGSIGATVLAPIDAAARAVGVKNDYIGRDDRRQQMTDATQALGANPDSFAYKSGKLLAEILGTAGAGGAIANGLRGAAGYAGLVSEAAPLANAIASNGFRAAPGLSTTANLLTRVGGGAVAGGAQVGLSDPEHAGIGAAIGGALPVAAKAVGMAGNALGDAAQDSARKLMKSALKPTEKMRQTGDADVAVQTLLDYGINPTLGGVSKIKGMIGDLNDQIAAAIDKSGAKIDKQKVMNALAGTREKFGNQVDPAGDLSAIDKVAEGFQNHPNYPGGELPVQAAQEMKQGTYRVLRGKYGEAGSASTEAQKSLARGLKDEIVSAVPEVAGLNAAESRLLKTLVVTERRALLDGNKNPVDLGSVVALASGHPGVAIGSIANSTAWTKAMAARGLNALSSGVPENVNALVGPAAYRSIPGTARR